MVFDLFFLAISLVCSCDPSSLVKKHEGNKKCMYLDSVHKKTIGIGFNLETPGAKAIVESVGADYDAIVNGPITPSNNPCNCNSVVCLNDFQIEDLFQIRYKPAVECAQKLASFCCNVQDVLVDMSYNLGCSGLQAFTTFLGLLKTQSWQAAADDLSVQKWCNQVGNQRCSEDTELIISGCGCTAPYARSCDTQNSGCCESTQTCCTGTEYFHPSPDPFTEWLCCPLLEGVCCKNNSCCASNYPVCCPNSGGCCSSNYPICCPNNGGCCPLAYPVCGFGTCYRSTDSEYVKSLPHQKSMRLL